LAVVDARLWMLMLMMLIQDEDETHRSKEKEQKETMVLYACFGSSSGLAGLSFSRVSQKGNSRHLEKFKLDKDHKKGAIHCVFCFVLLPCLVLLTFIH
jgi:hypothetical protein